MAWRSIWGGVLLLAYCEASHADDSCSQLGSHHHSKHYSSPEFAKPQDTYCMSELCEELAMFMYFPVKDHWLERGGDSIKVQRYVFGLIKSKSRKK